MRKLLILLLLLAFFVSGCSIEDREMWLVNKQKAISMAEKFCFAIAYDDINGAKDYLHPDSPLHDNLPVFISEIEQDGGFDFSDGVAIMDRELGEGTTYDSTYKGGVHAFTLEVVVNGKTHKLSFEVVDNEKGFGIFSFKKV